MALLLPQGLAIDPPEAIDLTLQDVSTPEQKRQVLSAWDGDTLRYLITVEKLPPGWLPVNAYFAELVNNFRAAGTAVETVKRSDYPTVSGLEGSYLVVKTKATPKARADLTVAHFITNGKVAYVAFARLIAAIPADQFVDETIALFKTARIALPEVPVGAQPGAGTP